MLAQTGGQISTGESAWQIILSGGITGVAILLTLVVVSMIATALVIEHFVSIRRANLIPHELAQNVHTQLAANHLDQAIQHCTSDPSALAMVLESGLQETPGGWPAIEKGMEEALAEQAARLLRKIDYLSVIGNIAPMIGLLGTVVGMIFAFQEVASTQGAARAAELASGIYQALVTTVGGLVVAIPSLAAFAIFRNRVDQLIAETGRSAQQAIAPLKRRFQSAALPPLAMSPATTSPATMPPPVTGKPTKGTP